MAAVSRHMQRGAATADGAGIINTADRWLAAERTGANYDDDDDDEVCGRKAELRSAAE